MRLAELQDRVQSAILRDDFTTFPPCRETLSFGGEMRFRVYSDAYRLRLAAFLSNEYPVLREALGDERFGALVEAFIGAVPSRVPTAQAYTRQLPEFLVSAEPWCEDRATIDLAQFECALGRAFDAADAPSLGIGSLVELAQDSWPNLIVTFHPSAVAVVVLDGTMSAYERLSSDEASGVELRAADIPGVEREEMVLIWRGEQGVIFRVMEAIERQVFEAARTGWTFAEVCTILTDQGQHEESVTQAAATFLSRWFADGIIAAVAVRGS